MDVGIGKWFAVSASANMRPPSQKPEDDKILARLTTEDLKELGVVAIGDLRRLPTAIADLSCPCSGVQAERRATMTPSCPCEKR